MSTLISKLKSILASMPNQQARNAFLVTLGILASVFPSAGFYTYLGFQTGAWQLYLLAFTTFLASAILGIAAFLCWRGQVDLGIGVLLGAGFMIGVDVAATFAGLGLPASLVLF